LVTKILTLSPSTHSIVGNAQHGRADFARMHRTRRAEIGLGEFARPGRKPERGELRDRACEVMDRVVGAGTAAVATRIGEGHVEVHVGLLGGLHRIDERLAVVRQFAAAGIAVQQQLGVLELLG
jgi:hypothetical protein